MFTEIRHVLVVALVALFTGVLSFGATATRTGDDLLAGGTTGNLSVAVFDVNGGKVAGANVVLFDASGAVAGQGTTGNNGKATFNGIDAGDYTVFASKVTVVFGFPIGTFGSTSVTVSAGGTTGAIVVLDRYTY